MEASAALESDALKFVEIVCLLDLIDNFHNLILFCAGVEYSLLTNFLSLKLVKVIWDSSHLAELRYQQDLDPALLLVFDFQ